MKIQIKNRWNASLIFECEVADDEQFKMRVALRMAIESKADLRSADLQSADLRSANLQSADLQYADLQYADLQYADLRSANLRSANLQYADLRYANLQYADLRSADLQSADLRYADLQYANLQYANLQYADLQYANLQYANLRSADLRYADLQYANLRYADLQYANLQYAKRLREARGVRLPTGELFEDYLRETVPALLTAGGKSLEEVIGSGCWDCHDWSNCPMHVAFGIGSPDEGPPLLRPHIKQFVELFDAGQIPCPVIETKSRKRKRNSQRKGLR